MKEPIMPKADEKAAESTKPPHSERQGHDPATEQAGDWTMKGLLAYGVLSSAEAAMLKPGSMNEIMVRFADGLAKLGEASEGQKRKIRRVLGLGPRPGDPLPQPEQRSREIEGLMHEMRGYLKGMQEALPDVVGLVLCGSRMDKMRLPDPQSDVDVVVIRKSGTATDPRTPEGEKNLFDLRGYTDSHATGTGQPVEVDGIYAADKFIEAMKSPEENSRLIWGWNPDALAYIGDSIEDMSEQDVESFISLELKSEKAENLRRQMVKRAVEKITAAKP